MYYDHKLRPILDAHQQIIRYPSGCLFAEYNTAFVMRHHFDSLKICLVDESVLRYPADRIEFESVYLSDINNSDIDVILIPSDHLYVEEIKELESLFKKPYLILSSDTGSTNSIFYPYWITTYPSGYEIDTSVTNNKLTRTFLYSCLNFHPHPHRISNLVKLHQSTYWDRTLITFADVIKHYQTREQAYHTHPNVNEPDVYVPNGTQYFVGHLLALLPMAPDPDLSDTSTMEKLLQYTNRAYLDSYVNISMESYLDIPFITEKTTKCFLAEQFFVPYAAPGFVQYLDNLGFDTYSDIIDHAAYDSIQNNKERMDRMHVLLDTMQHWDWASIYAKTQTRRTANRNIILSGQFLTQAVRRIEHAITTLVPGFKRPRNFGNLAIKY
jgi:hypothetical protein